MRSTMIRATVGVALVLSAGCAMSPSAYRNRDEPINRTTGEGQQYYGNVARVDEGQQIIVLDNGQAYRIAGNQSVLVDGRPTLLGRLQPGTPVTIVAATPVVNTPGVMRLYGRVTHVDHDGNVTVKLPAGDTFEFRPPAGTVVRRGD